MRIPAPVHIGFRKQDAPRVPVYVPYGTPFLGEVVVGPVEGLDEWGVTFSVYASGSRELLLEVTQEDGVSIEAETGRLAFSLTAEQTALLLPGVTRNYTLKGDAGSGLFLIMLGPLIVQDWTEA